MVLTNIARLNQRSKSRGITIEHWVLLNAFLAFTALLFIPMFGTLAAALFILASLACASVRISPTINSLTKYGYLLILPIYCLFSSTWSNYLDITLRYSLQLTVTLIIAVILAQLITSKSLIKVLFFAYLLGFIICVLIEVKSHTGRAWSGFYGSKNGFAALASILLLIALAVQKIPEMRSWRYIALGYIVVSPVFIILAQSAGAILALFPVVCSVFFFRSISFMSKSAKRILMWLLIALSGFMGLLLSVNSEMVTGGVLEYFGKDATLTGRTELWEFAYSLIAKNPLFGVGYRGFWVIGNPDAEALWAEFLVPSGAGFNFHNTYISNAVELGYVGVLIQIFILYIALYRGFRLSLKAPSPENIFWFSIVAFTISRSFSEVTVFYEFAIQSVLPFIAYIKIDQGLRRFSRQTSDNRNPPVKYYRIPTM